MDYAWYICPYAPSRTVAPAFLDADEGTAWTTSTDWASAALPKRVAAKPPWAVTVDLPISGYDPNPPRFLFAPLVNTSDYASSPHPYGVSDDPDVECTLEFDMSKEDTAFYWSYFENITTGQDIDSLYPDPISTLLNKAGNYTALPLATWIDFKEDPSALSTWRDRVRLPLAGQKDRLLNPVFAIGFGKPAGWDQAAETDLIVIGVWEPGLSSGVVSIKGWYNKAQATKCAAGTWGKAANVPPFTTQGFAKAYDYLDCTRVGGGVTGGPYVPGSRCDTVDIWGYIGVNKVVPFPYSFQLKQGQRKNVLACATNGHGPGQGTDLVSGVVFTLDMWPPRVATITRPDAGCSQGLPADLQIPGVLNLNTTNGQCTAPWNNSMYLPAMCCNKTDVAGAIAEAFTFWDNGLQVGQGGLGILSGRFGRNIAFLAGQFFMDTSLDPYVGFRKRCYKKASPSTLVPINTFVSAPSAFVSQADRGLWGELLSPNAVSTPEFDAYSKEVKEGVNTVFKGKCRYGCTFDSWVALYKVQKSIEAAMYLPSAFGDLINKCPDDDPFHPFVMDPTLIALFGDPGQKACLARQSKPPDSAVPTLISSILATILFAVKHKGNAKMTVEEKLVARMIADEVRAARLHAHDKATAIVDSWAAAVDKSCWNYPSQELHNYKYESGSEYSCAQTSGQYALPFGTIFNGYVPRKPEHALTVGLIQAFGPYIKNDTREGQWLETIRENFNNYRVFMVQRDAAAAVDAAKIFLTLEEQTACESTDDTTEDSNGFTARDKCYGSGLRGNIDRLRLLLADYPVVSVASKEADPMVWFAQNRPYVAIHHWVSGSSSAISEFSAAAGAVGPDANTDTQAALTVISSNTAANIATPALAEFHAENLGKLWAGVTAASPITVGVGDFLYVSAKREATLGGIEKKVAFKAASETAKDAVSAFTAAQNVGNAAREGLTSLGAKTANKVAEPLLQFCSKGPVKFFLKTLARGTIILDALLAVLDYVIAGIEIVENSVEKVKGDITTSRNSLVASAAPDIGALAETAEGLTELLVAVARLSRPR